MGRDLQIVRAGAPQLPGRWLCACGFADPLESTVCRRPEDLVIAEALRGFALKLAPRDRSSCEAPHFVGFEAGYFRAAGILGLWADLEAAGFAEARTIDYQSVISAEQAREVADRLDVWLPRRRAELLSVRHVVASIGALRAESYFQDYPDELGDDLRRARDGEFDQLRWSGRFAEFHRVAASFGGYRVT